MKKLLIPLALSFCVSCSASADDLCQYDIAGATLSNNMEEAVKIWTDHGFVEQENFRGMGSATTKTLDAPKDANHYIQSLSFIQKSENGTHTNNIRKNYNAITVTYAPKKEAEDKENYIAFQQEILKNICATIPDYIQEAAKQELPNNDLQLRSKITAAQATMSFCAALEEGTPPKYKDGFVNIPRPHTLAKRDLSQAGCFAQIGRSFHNGLMTISYQSAAIDSQ